MAHFTTSNTEGYTTEELAVLNAAYEQITEEAGIDNDMGRIDDAITNAWYEGMTTGELVNAVKAKIAA